VNAIAPGYVETDMNRGALIPRLLLASGASGYMPAASWWSMAGTW